MKAGKETSALLIRPAVADDARFIARNIFRALLVDDPNEARVNVLESICRRDDTLYSWRNTIIAMYNDKCAGILVSYDGANYHAMRDITFPLFLNSEDYSGMDDECRAGEMYCDSLAIEPEFQHMGIGSALLDIFLKRSADEGLTATIAVEPDNSVARRLYESRGFLHQGWISLFGHKYLRMAAGGKLTW
ncbi:MAG: GNAT family N-acetyltransferase [Bacteroidaceae bacterium]|nr:GNAT family N-acetyltransferase [Bacteroidaceae bacterium]